MVPWLVLLAVASAVPRATSLLPGTFEESIQGEDKAMAVFVSPFGRDTNPATRTSPVATLHRVQEVARSLRGPVAICIDQGKYELAVPLSFSAQDSNTTWTSWHGSDFCGEGASGPSTPVLTSSPLRGLSWEQIKDGVWSAPIEGTFQANITQLFVDGVRHPVARTSMEHWTEPLSGSDATQGFMVGPTSIPSNWSTEPGALRFWRVIAFHSWVVSRHTVSSFDRSSGKIMFGEAAKFAYGTELYCSQKRFYIEGARELSLTKGSGQWRIVPGSPAAAPDVVCSRGAKCSLEWAPTTLLPPSNSTFVLPTLSTLVEIVGATNLRVSNLTMAFTTLECPPGTACDSDSALGLRAAALSATRTTGLLLDGITVHGAGTHAISVSNSPGAVLRRLLVSSAGAMSVHIEASPGASLVDSWVQGFGQMVPAGNGVTLSRSPNAVVSRCDISGGFENGVQLGCQNDGCAGAMVKGNNVHDNGVRGETGTCDFGGIHIGTLGSKEPVWIVNNVFANITAFANGGEGMYADVGATGQQLISNLVYNVSSTPLFWHVNPFVPMRADATPSNITDNILISNAVPTPFYATSWDKRKGLEWWAYTPGHRFERNVVVVDYAATGTVLMWDGQPCGDIEDPAKTGVVCTDKLSDSFAKVTVDSNLYYNSTSSWSLQSSQGAQNRAITPPTVHGHTRYPSHMPAGPNSTELSSSFPDLVDWREWRQMGHDKDSVLADPEFVAPVHADYRLRPSSPALRLGMRPIDMNMVGPTWMPNPEMAENPLSPYE